MKNQHLSHILLVFSILIVSGQAILAQTTVQIPAVKDNTLYQDASGAISNGSGAYLFVGNNGSGNTRRAVIAFNIDDAVPEGATITSANLQLNMSKTTSGGQSLSLHRIVSDWGEGTSDAADNEGAGASSTAGDATWLHRFFETDMWETEGGDFQTEASSEITVSGQGSYTWPSANSTVANVQLWLDDGTKNFGWLVKGNESEGATSKRFDSRENSDAQSHPVLEVSYTENVTTVRELSTKQGLITGFSNFPNPFSAETTLSYQLNVGEDVSLRVSDILGQEILILIDGYMDQGSHSAVFSLSDLDQAGPGSGVYYAILVAGKERRVIRMVCTK